MKRKVSPSPSGILRNQAVEAKSLQDLDEEPVPPVPWANIVPKMKALYLAAGEYGLAQAFLVVMSENGTHVKVSITHRRQARADKR